MKLAPIAIALTVLAGAAALLATSPTHAVSTPVQVASANYLPLSRRRPPTEVRRGDGGRPSPEGPRFPPPRPVSPGRGFFLSVALDAVTATL